MFSKTQNYKVKSQIKKEYLYNQVTCMVIKLSNNIININLKEKENLDKRKHSPALYKYETQ